MLSAADSTDRIFNAELREYQKGGKNKKPPMKKTPLALFRRLISGKGRA
jgi:hypothetical protein